MWLYLDDRLPLDNLPQVDSPRKLTPHLHVLELLPCDSDTCRPGNEIPEISTDARLRCSTRRLYPVYYHTCMYPRAL